MHEIERPAEPALPEFALEPLQIAVYQRLDKGIRARGRDALVFPQLRDHFRRERYGDLRVRGADRRASNLLVHGIAICVEEADGDRLDPFVGKPFRRGQHAVDDKRRHHDAITVKPLNHLEPPPSRYERIRIPEEEIVDVVSLLRPDL